MDFDQRFQDMIANDHALQSARLIGRTEEKTRILRILVDLEQKTPHWQGTPKELCQMLFGLQRQDN